MCDQRSQLSDHSDDSEKGSPRYLRESQSEEVMRYEEEVMKRREVMGNDRAPIQGECGIIPLREYTYAIYCDFYGCKIDTEFSVE